MKQPTRSVMANDLRSQFRYDPDTGYFWRLRRIGRAKPGVPAGSGAHGYVLIGINNGQIYAHRLAWLYMTGEWPSGEIDHINGCKSDNRWANLRTASRSENQANTSIPTHNTSGVLGVGWDKRRRTWRAYIKVNRKYVHLGHHPDIESAILARRAAEQRHFGPFAPSLSRVQ